jgi:hypothetical protein
LVLQTEHQIHAQARVRYLSIATAGTNGYVLSRTYSICVDDCRMPLLKSVVLRLVPGRGRVAMADQRHSCWQPGPFGDDACCPTLASASHKVLQQLVASRAVLGRDNRTTTTVLVQAAARCCSDTWLSPASGSYAGCNSPATLLLHVWPGYAVRSLSRHCVHLTAVLLRSTRRNSLDRAPRCTSAQAPSPPTPVAGAEVARCRRRTGNACRAWPERRERPRSRIHRANLDRGSLCW